MFWSKKDKQFDDYRTVRLSTIKEFYNNALIDAIKHKGTIQEYFYRGKAHTWATVYNGLSKGDGLEPLPEIGFTHPIIEIKVKQLDNGWSIIDGEKEN